MADPNPRPEPPPPLGSWARVYLLVALAAVIVMAVLWGFTAAFNMPMDVR